MHVGASLRVLRLQAGVGLRALAQEVGVSPAYISRVELGRDPPPTADRLARIARALGLSPGALLAVGDRTDPPVAAWVESSPMADQLVVELARRRLSEAQVARVLGFVRAEFPLQGAPRPALGALLSPDRVLCGVRVERLRDALDLLATRLADPREVAWVAERMAARESVSSTAIGGGVALPVAPGPALQAALMTLSPALPSETPDGRPLCLLFAFRGLPAGSAGVELVLRATRLARPAVTAAVCAAASPEDARSALERAEAGWL
jgi:PTS system nitrogen regulatory IIA component